MAFLERPRPYTVLLDLTHQKDGSRSSRLFGTFTSPETARKNIAENEKECRKMGIDTYRRSYRIFRAAWVEVTSSEVTA
jgi:hypothetical protein